MRPEEGKDGASPAPAGLRYFCPRIEVSPHARGVTMDLYRGVVPKDAVSSHDGLRPNWVNRRREVPPASEPSQPQPATR